MTREQLDAIRVLRSNCEHSFDGCFRGHLTEADYTNLLAEVDRLKNELAMVVQVSGELCEKCGWAMKFPKEKCRCELLAKSDAVFNRGVQAGREQVISYLGLQAAVFTLNVEQMQKNIRTMQFPEDK